MLLQSSTFLSFRVSDLPERDLILQRPHWVKLHGKETLNTGLLAGRIRIKTHQAALRKVRPSLLFPENNCMLIIMSKHSLDLTLCSWKTDERRTFSGG